MLKNTMSARNKLMLNAIQGNSEAFQKYQEGVKTNEFEPFTIPEIISKLVAKTDDVSPCTELWIHLGVYIQSCVYGYSQIHAEQYWSLVKYAKNNMKNNNGVVFFLLTINAELPDHAKVLTEKDYQTIISFSKENNEDSLAQYNLSFLCRYGLGVDADVDEACRLCRNAALQGLLVAMHALDWM